MLELSEININDKALFDRYFAASNPQPSEMTFTNLFMWRNSYKFRYTEIEGLLCIIAVPEGGEPFAFMPVGNTNPEAMAGAIEQLKGYFSEHGWQLQFKRVYEEALDAFKPFVSLEADVQHDRASSDYVYLASDLIGLKGKKFDGKRNHINKFKKLYEYEYAAIDKTNIEDCHKIMETWCRERNCTGDDDFYREKVANSELLDNYEVLGCKGALVKVNGSSEAFTVGEMLNRDTAVIHIEKANAKVNGLYTFINQQFCENEWQNTQYINREQDLGIEGLRKAKLSYNPVRLVNKYTVHMA